MVYYQISGIGFNCGRIKENCHKSSSNSCRECIIDKLKELGFEVTSDTKYIEVESIENRLQVERDLIWKKFLDVLNIKHIVIMDKESGLALLNYPVSAIDIEVDLLSGFIQANISFSETSKGLNSGSSSMNEQSFYELQYQKFNMFLKNGRFIRVILILDHKASELMKIEVSQFLQGFEKEFEDLLTTYQYSGAFSSTGMNEFIIKSFDIDFVYPMTLAHAIPPGELKKIEANKIQNAILSLIKDTLKTKPFFYINSMLYKVKKIVNIELQIILHSIYKLLENKIIEPVPLETVANNLETSQKSDQKRATKIKSISSIIISDTDMVELEEQMSRMDGPSALVVINTLTKRGKAAEKSSTYDISLKEYNKALIIAKRFQLKDMINKISFMVFEIEKKAKQLELDFSLQSGENAEKNKDYINAIFQYQKAVKILEDFLIYDSSDSKIKKLKKKIVKLREVM
ncbi:MAG: hypothetical protein ACTSPS_10425 [Promethearchaeota archaeon]